MILPKLRRDLHMMPSPDPQRPGLLIRDHFRYSDAWLILPPLLVQGLKFFDGVRTDLDLQSEFVRLSGQPDMSEATRHLIETLDKAGFLDNATFIQLRDTRYQEFAASPLRKALHAGNEYPRDPAEMRKTLEEYLTGPQLKVEGPLLGIAAPHVSLRGGRHCYNSAYRTLTLDLEEKTFVILGTSHFGPPNRFGLTRKPFETPLGITETAPALLDELAKEPAVIMEDYCQAIEHSIELQVVFLQTLYGPKVRILPILCGSFGPSLINHQVPESDDHVRRFFGTLANIAARDRQRLFWIMGIDMAHMGIRYGDRFEAIAGQNEMLQVQERDHGRIDCLSRGDSGGFWAHIQENRDDLRWCGSSPLYTFMKVFPEARGTLQRYEQWNIDARSVVSFAGLSFTEHRL